MTIELYFLVPGDLNALTGGYAYDRELIRALSSLGVRIHIIMLGSGFPDPDTAALNDAEQKLAAIPDHSLVLIDGLAGGVMDKSIRQHCQRLSIIMLCHHPLAFETGISQSLREARLQSEKISLLHAHSIIVTSRATARLLQEVFELQQSSITVALPGTAPQNFAPCTGQPPVLLTVATVIPRKAHDVLIKALSRITDIPWQARFVGGTHFDPLWYRQLCDQIDRSGLEHRVQFSGSIEDLTSEYQNAALFVLPSRFEGYGMAFAEALSFGLPVVAARAGAVPDVVPEDAGILVSADDDLKLADALRCVLTDSRLYQQLRQGAQNAAASLPTWQDSAKIVYQLLERLQEERFMSRFSTDWLDLREPADFTSRNKPLADQAVQWLNCEQTTTPVIVDLGSGTGSNLRALTALGAKGCIWRLVDNDPLLLNEALRRHAQQEAIEDHEADLGNVGELPLGGIRLLTASALFDLVSAPIIDALINRLQDHNCAFYAALNYDGQTQWSPPHPLDNAVLEAFNKDQLRDKGLGHSLGPQAAAYLEQHLEAAGYTVHTADSPWYLDGSQAELVNSLIEGIHGAVSQGYGFSAAALDEWKRFRLSHTKQGLCIIGHTDVLALPANTTSQIR